MSEKARNEMPPELLKEEGYSQDVEQNDPPQSSEARFLGDSWIANTREGNVVIVEKPPKQGDDIVITEYTQQNYEKRPWHAERVEIVNSDTGELLILDGKYVKKETDK